MNRQNRWKTWSLSSFALRSSSFVLDSSLFSLARRPLARNVFKVLSGNFAGNALNFVATVILTRTLDVASFGVFTTLQTPMNLMAQISDFGLNTTVIKYYREWTAECREGDAEVLLRRALTLRLAFVGLIAGLAFLFAGAIAARLGVPGHAALFRWICLGAVGAALWSYCQAAMQARQQFGWYAVLTTLNHGLRLILVVALLRAGWLTLAPAVGVAVAIPILGTLAAAALWPARLWRARMDPAALRRSLAAMFRFSRWVFLSAVLTLIIMRLDVLMLAPLAGSRAVAQYGNAFNFAQVFPLLAYALSTVLLPRLAASRSRADLLRVRAVIWRAVPLLAAGGLACAVAAHLLIPRLLGDAYRPSIPVFDVLTAGYLLSIVVTPLSFCCYAFDKAHWIAAMNAAQLVLNFVLDLLLIPHWGALGAGAAGLIRLFALLYLAFVFRRLLQMAEPDAPASTA